MKKYIEILFSPLQPGQADLLVAVLADAGYYGFLEDNTEELKAYIMPEDFDPTIPEGISGKYSCSFTQKIIEETNWNAEWEASFEPVVINNFVSVRADFHNIVKDVEYEIIITPKMSFGTGHHATTYLVMEAMEGLSWEGMDVLDFGSGTGILAILAENMGAKSVLAIDNDHWSMENARENLERNHCSRIELLEADTVPAERSFDRVLANINRHILLKHAAALARALEPGGVLLMSGVLEEDLPVMQAAFVPLLGPVIEWKSKNNWLRLSFKKNGA